MAIFQKSVINKHLNNLNKEQVEKAYQKYRDNYSPAKIEKIKQLKEEEYQDGFLRDIFVDVFGYILKPDNNFNLVREFKNQDDGKKADGAILKDEKAIVVIELKSTKTKDLKSITEQAFNYKNNQPECKYVITSNFQKLRFYIDYANEFEEFDLFNLQKEDFDLLYLILNTNSVFSDLPLTLKKDTKFHEQNISNKLYKDYSNFKRKLFENLIKNNLDNNGLQPIVFDKLLLFKKSQKLLDRFLFILFAEDSGLLPPNSISRIVKRYEILKDEDAYKPLYEIFKQYFGYMNIGRKGKNAGDDIPAYNGGLFYTDEKLDCLKIDDDILIDDLLKLSSFDFNTEVDVNILGHIFEHSLSEIEEITAEIEGTTTDKTKSKRKKDGVFYTPKYITQYIVENTIGTLCTEKRKDLDIIEIEFDGTYRTKDGNLSAKGKKLYQKLKDYKDWLLSLKIVDPACGSGAFLNQALNFLIQEHQNIDDIIAELTNTALRLFDTEKNILENNLYGVDINEESVEIAKLSLWLRTAQKGRKLSVLSNNIKCGNSLIDDPEIAGEKAFNWNKEFPQVFKEKEKKAWHITTATHNSRYSQRMFDNHVKTGDAIWLDEKDEIIISETITEIVKKDNLNVIEYNICGDHMHLLLVCDEKDRDSIVGKIKAVSSRKYNIEKGITISSTATSRTTRGHVPLSASVATADEKEREDAIPLSASVATIDEKEREDAIPLSDTETEGKKEKKKYNSLWTQKFGKSEIKDENYLNNTIEYIRNNRIKHELPKSKEIEKIKKEFLCSKEYAHRAEYKGGFDVVIGNPPYVVVSSSDIFSHYYSNNYKVSKGGKTNLYKLFFELSIGLIKNNISKLGFITPSNYLTSNDSLETRNFILKNVKIDCIVEYPEKENVFKNVTQAVAIITLSKPILKKYTFNYTKEQFEDIINISKILKNKRKLIKGENITIKKINSFKNKFDDFIEGYQGEINVSTKKEHFIFEKNESNLQLIRGNHISRYLQKEEINEFCPITISNRKHHLIERIIFQEVSNSGINRRINALIKTNILCGHTTNYVFSKLSEINNKQLLLILNSKLVNYYFKFYNMTNHVPIGEIKSIPLPSISSINSCDFNSKADKMLSLNKRLQEKKNKFLNRIKDNFEIEKISKKVDVFYEYDFKTFVTELKKQKIKFLLVQQDEWEEYFNSYKTEINQLQDEINTTDKEIDQMVYDLYELAEEEIKIVEESVI